MDQFTAPNAPLAGIGSPKNYLQLTKARTKNMPKSPIWLTDEELEILGGYIAEFLDDPTINETAIPTLETVYNQIYKEN